MYLFTVFLLGYFVLKKLGGTKPNVLAVAFLPLGDIDVGMSWSVAAARVWVLGPG